MSECKHCAMESSHCHYCCDGAQIDMLKKENAELRAEVKSLAMKLQLREIQVDIFKSRIEGGEG